MKNLSTAPDYHIPPFIRGPHCPNTVLNHLDERYWDGSMLCDGGGQTRPKQPRLGFRRTVFAVNALRAYAAVAAQQSIIPEVIGQDKPFDGQAYAPGTVIALQHEVLAMQRLTPLKMPPWIFARRDMIARPKIGDQETRSADGPISYSTQRLLGVVLSPHRRDATAVPPLAIIPEAAIQVDDNDSHLVDHLEARDGRIVVGTVEHFKGDYPFESLERITDVHVLHQPVEPVRQRSRLAAVIGWTALA